MINIDSDKGHVGEFWWINSNPSEIIYGKSYFTKAKESFVHWGTCGYGQDINVSIEQISNTSESD